MQARQTGMGLNMHNIPSIDMRLISGTDSLEKIREDWQAVLNEMENPPIMLSPDWLFRWWKYYGDNRELRVGQFFEGETCIGIAPLCLRTHHYRGGLSFERLEFMGAEGQDEDDIGSDYLNLIARPGRETEVANCFAHHLVKGTFGDWHECVLDAMNGDAPMSAHLSAAFEHLGQSVTRTQTVEAPYLPLTADWDSYMAKLSKSRRYWFRRTFRDFEAHAGEDGYQLHEATDPKSLSNGLKILADLHEVRWQMSGEDGVFNSDRFSRFHEDYASYLLEQNLLQLTWLTIGNKPVAVQYNIRGIDKIYFYQSGRLMDTPPKVRLGIALFILTIRDAMEKGYKEFDFLACEDDYKYIFTKNARPIMKLRIARPSAREKIRETLVRGRDLTKKAKNKIGELKKGLGKPKGYKKPVTSVSRLSDT